METRATELLRRLLAVFRRRHPARDLRARAESELVEDAADMAVDGALRDEQPGADLLVAQTVRDQARDVGGAERSSVSAPRGCSTARAAACARSGIFSVCASARSA